MSKKKEKELIPLLRFPEFKKDLGWDNPALNEIADRITDKVGERQLTTVSISAGIGFVSQSEKFSRDISGQQYKNYISIKAGDFSYNKGNSKKYAQGCIYKLKEFREAAAPNAFVSFRFRDKVVPDFYQGYFESNFHGPQLQKFISSGARMDGLLNISPIDFFTIIFPTPKSRKEQQKIADCLASLGNLISAEHQKLEALKAHKKGLMQQLFPTDGEKVPKLRFKEFKNRGEWEMAPLNHEDVSSFISDKIDNEELSLESYISTENILADYAGVIKAPKLPQSGSFTKFKEGDILISNIRPYLKKVWFSDKNGAASNDVIVVRAGSRLTANFLSLHLRNDEFINYVMKGAQGVKMPRGDKYQMQEYPILFPSKTEQQKISDCFSFLDDLTTTQNKKVQLLKSHKKGLIQQLFPSTSEIEA